MRLLRYRFDSPRQIPPHFHPVNGRMLLFYPSLLALRPGVPVILDVSFIASDQHCVVRGAAIGREAGNAYAGSWLEFGAGIASSLRAATVHARRRQRRFPVETLVHVERGRGLPEMARLVDVGLGGGRLRGLSRKVAAGDRLRFSLPSGEPAALEVPVRVAWVRGAELGFEFDHASRAERSAIGALVEEARHKLSGAYEATHPTFCRCGDGEPVPEPPLPRSVHRTAG